MGGNPGRRAKLSEEQITEARSQACETIDQLKLLNEYAGKVGVEPLNIDTYGGIISVLNSAAHGRVPAKASRSRLRWWRIQTGRILDDVRNIGR